MEETLSIRRSLLYVPGNMPSMLQNIPIFNCDAVFIDLEDAVPLNEKDAARILVKSFIESYKDRNKEVFFRINPLDTEWGYDDLLTVLPALPDGVRLPKADTPEIVERLDTFLTECEENLGLEIGRFKIIPSIESAQGVINCIKTARCSSRVIALAFGAEDYTTSMGIERTKTGEELFQARNRVAWAAKAAGIQAIDTIFADVSDEENFTREVKLIKGLGFTGKSLVNPRQIDIVHKVFAPSKDEIDSALEIIEAIKQAREMGTGVISLRGKMIDAPIVKRAARVIRTAAALGMVDIEISDEVIHGAK
ncbi:HpcH/HpaI aldolase/citrate lyase family protein [Seleniivibrio woodruffii]|uniref:Citrate lyase subunit beta/citryl-CoA lyase n=1 Tax=Seleniivibrio woodruffii TaxID=1078050 RepID=A0A4R1KBM5_9BACT|nr:aldolase/citrate lyase family protein [Seleniivibrio woodruffii]TCK61906.1 citrate lyase subunit beta/citryl-CoA lyase [Seleniivibrio woodruffii]TVZ34977.1 citrate lyase subunit beta/citryl-CoA lyase [Seleniivibrio woodruffii]